MLVSKFTRNFMSKLPSWMKMSKDPMSIGAQFLDVFGVTFEDVETELNYMTRNFYIRTADTEMMDWIYKVPLQMEQVVDGTGAYDIQEVAIEQFDGSLVQAYHSRNIQNFYHREARLPNYWIDRHEGQLYLRLNWEDIEDREHPFQSVVINQAKHYDLIHHHVWNPFDEFGLLVGLSRLHLETNEAYKERILDVFKNPGGVTRTGIINGLARELNIPSHQIELDNLSNENYRDSLILPNGNPSVRLMRYAKQINETLKYTWDTMNFGAAYWFSIEQDNIAIEYLPHVWDLDTSAFKEEDFQSGVGFGDDLLVHKPVEEPSARKVKVSIGLMGYTEAFEEVHPEITFTYKIYAKGKIIEKDYQEQPYRYTVKATETFNQPYQIKAEADIKTTYDTNFTNSSFLNSGVPAPNIHFGKSTDILHNQSHRLVKLAMNFQQFDSKTSPEIKNLNLIWEDTAGAEHTFKFETSNDFFIDRNNTSGNPMTNVVTADTAFQDGKGMTLGYGAFHDNIDTTEEWRTGTWDVNNLVVQNGGLSLNLGRFNPPGAFGPQ